MAGLKMAIRALEEDKNELSKQCYQKTQEVTHLAEELRDTKAGIRYQAKMEILDRIESLSIHDDPKHYPTKD